MITFNLNVQEDLNNKHGGKKLIPLIKEVLKYQNETEPNEHKGKDGYISVSQFTGNACQRKLYLNYLNKEKREYEYRLDYIFSFGHLYHDWIQDILSKTLHLHGVEEYFQNDEMKVTGSIDGYIINDDGTYTIIDFKTSSLGSYQYIMNSRKAKKDHKHQLMFYAYLFMKKYPDRKVKSIKVLYINKNQGSFAVDIDMQLVQIDKVIKYLSDTLEKMKKLNRNSEELEDNIHYLENSKQSLINLLEKDKGEDYLFQEFDYPYDDNVNIIDEEIAKLDKFWLHVENEENKIKEAKRTEKEYKQKLLPKIANTTYCSSCVHYDKYCLKKTKDKVLLQDEII